MPFFLDRFSVLSDSHHLKKRSYKFFHTLSVNLHDLFSQFDQLFANRRGVFGIGSQL
jgi:hypothetical protein